MAVVHLDGMLREYAPVRKVEVPAGKVAEMLDGLEQKYPRLKLKLRDETGKVRRFVRVYVNGADIRGLSDLQTAIGESDEVHILHSIQGG